MILKSLLLCGDQYFEQEIRIFKASLLDAFGVDVSFHRGFGYGVKLLLKSVTNKAL